MSDRLFCLGPVDLAAEEERLRDFFLLCLRGLEDREQPPVQITTKTKTNQTPTPAKTVHHN